MAGRSKVTFVGNIPYDVTEETLREVFSEVGQVHSVRLVFDKDTGKAKGYGFVEFYDPETAASAVRNLNDVPVGGRPLRVDFAESDPAQDGGGGGGGGGGGAGGARRRPPQGAGGGVGGPPPSFDFSSGGPGGPSGINFAALPTGTMPPPGVNATDAISQTLASLPPNQLLDVMSKMKLVVQSSPDQARQLLSQNPQLAYALFQAMLMMNIVDPAIIQRMLTDTSGQQQQQPPMMQQTQGYNAPPPAAANPALGGITSEQQKALLNQVMQLTPAQINAMPPSQRDQILALRAQLGVR